jgi:sugar lactone lactonase YvrE
VRRLAVVCVVAVTIFAAFVAIGKNSGAFAAGRQSGAPSGSSGIVSSYKVSVFAANIAARALAVAASGSPASLALTNASAPNQIFTLGSNATPSNPSASVRVAALAGTGVAGSLGDGGAASAAEFDLSLSSLFERSGIAIAPDGTIYVADTGNATIRAIAGPSSTEPGVIRSAAGRWAARQNVALLEPLGIAVDRAGNLYIADHGAGAIDVMSAGSSQLQTLAQVAGPASIVVSPNGGTVFVASPDNGAVFAINTQTHAIAAVSGFAPSASGQSACAAAAGSSTTQICPAGLAVDAAGNLFVSDANSGRILRVDAQTSATTVVAADLNQPGELAFDANGNLYAAEQRLNRIVAFAQVGTSQGSISLSPNSGTFGNVATGGTSASQTFTLTNTTSAAVTGLSIPKTTTPADFSVLTNNCTATLAANASCTLSVAFSPTATGARSATLTVTDANAADSASTALSGTGDDYELQLATGQLMSVSVQGGAAITMNLQVVPDNVFSGTVTLVCPTNLPTNTTCTFSTPSVNVTPGTAAPFQVTFQTTGLINPINTRLLALPRFPSDWTGAQRFAAVALGAFFAMMFAWTLFTPAVRNRFSPPSNSKSASLPSRWMRTAVPAFALLALALAILAGCKKSTVVFGSTPSGSTNMNIAGTAQNTSRAVTVTLNVVTE